MIYKTIENSSNIKISISKIKNSRFSKINQDILNLINENPELILAGGALRTLIDKEDIIKDFDIFFAKISDVQETITKLNNIGFKVVWECPKGELFNLKNPNGEKIQLILPTTAMSPEEWLGKFDIRAGKIALNSNFIFISKNTIKDIQKKLIVLDNVTLPIATFYRVVKYKEKGYKIHYQEVGDFLLRSSMIINESLNDLDWRKYSID